MRAVTQVHSRGILYGFVKPLAGHSQYGGLRRHHIHGYSFDKPSAYWRAFSRIVAEPSRTQPLFERIKLDQCDDLHTYIDIDRWPDFLDGSVINQKRKNGCSEKGLWDIQPVKMSGHHMQRINRIHVRWILFSSSSSAIWRSRVRPSLSASIKARTS